MPKPKNKHVTQKYLDQLKNVLMMFEQQEEYFAEQHFENRDNYAEDLTTLSNHDLLEYFRNQVSSLLSAQPEENYRRQNKSFLVTSTMEATEAKILSIKTELRNRIDTFEKNTGYNRTEGRFFQYASSILDAYDDVQKVMDNIEEPFQKTADVFKANDHIGTYNEAQEELVVAESNFYQYIDSEDFNAENLSQEVKEAFHGANFTLESMLEHADFEKLESSLANQSLKEEKQKNALESEIEQKKKAIGISFEDNGQKFKDEYEQELQNQKQIHQKVVDDIEGRAQKHFETIYATRPVEKVTQYSKDVGTFKGSDFSQISETYKISEDDLLKDKTLEELTSLSEKVTEQLQDRRRRQRNLNEERILNQSEQEVTKATWDMFKDLNSVEDDVDYQNLIKEEEARQQKVDEVSELIDQLSVSGFDSITPEYLKKNNLDITIPENTQRPKDIAAGTKAIYDEIGRGTVTHRWTKDGEELNKAVKIIQNNLIGEFQDLGWDSVTFGVVSTDELLNMDENESPTMEAPKEEGPQFFSFTDDLKNDYYNIVQLMIEASEQTQHFNEFGYFNNRTSPKEAMLTAKLVERREDIAKFAKSINPLLEEDEKKQQRLISIKTDLQDAVSTLNKLAKNEKVMAGLTKVTEAMKPSEQEEKLIQDVQNKLEERRETYRQDKENTTALKERHENSFVSNKRQAQTKLLHAENEADRIQNEIVQVGKDVEYLALVKSIVDEQLEKAKLEQEKVIAQAEIDKLKVEGTAETKRYKDVKATLEKSFQGKVEEIKKEAIEGLIKLDEEYAKKIQNQEKKLQMVSNFNEKVKELNTSVKKLRNEAVHVANDHQQLEQKKVIAKENLTNEHRMGIQFMDNREAALFSELSQTKRWRSDSEQYTNMMNAMRAYIEAKPQTPDTTQTVDQFRDKASKARQMIGIYIHDRDKNHGAKKTDVGQQRLDGAYRFLKMLDKREEAIKQYHKDINTITNAMPTKVYPKTKVEEKILSNLDVQPTRGESVIARDGHHLSIVGNPQIREELFHIADSYEGVSPMLSDMLVTEMNSLVAGNGKAMTKIIAITEVMQMGQSTQAKGKEFGDETAKALLGQLVNYDTIRDVAKDVLKGDVAPKDIVQKIRSENFGNALREETNRRMPKPENVKKDEKAVDNKKEVEKKTNIKNNVGAIAHS